MNKQIALALISQALYEKSVGIGVRAFINGDEASKRDLHAFYGQVLDGDDCLTKAYQDENGFWHFTSIEV